MQEARLLMIEITPSIQLVPVLMLHFCDFHLMWELLKGYLYFAKALLNSSQMAPVAEKSAWYCWWLEEVDGF